MFHLITLYLPLLTQRAQTEAVTFLGNQDNGRTLYAVPGLDYIGHEDVMPYTADTKRPIRHDLFDKFLAHDENRGGCVLLLDGNRSGLYLALIYIPVQFICMSVTASCTPIALNCSNITLSSTSVRLPYTSLISSSLMLKILEVFVLYFSLCFYLCFYRSLSPFSSLSKSIFFTQILPSMVVTP